MGPHHFPRGETAWHEEKHFVPYHLGPPSGVGMVDRPHPAFPHEDKLTSVEYLFPGSATLRLARLAGDGGWAGR